jgi:anti-sigma factor RsiW
MTGLACASGVELLMDYLEGELDAETRDAIDAHVAACARCAAFIDSYRATPEILRRATARSLPADLAAALLRSVRERLAGRPGRGASGRGRRPPDRS